MNFWLENQMEKGIKNDYFSERSWEFEFAEEIKMKTGR